MCDYVKWNFENNCMKGLECQSETFVPTYSSKQFDRDYFEPKVVDKKDHVLSVPVLFFLQGICNENPQP